METSQIKISTVYTFAMPKYVYVQVKGVEKSVRIHADEVKKDGDIGNMGFKLKILRGGSEVGEFSGNQVDGWWIEDERI